MYGREIRISLCSSNEHLPEVTRKRVTFAEQGCKGQDFIRAKQISATRSSGHCYPQSNRYTDHTTIIKSQETLHSKAMQLSGTPQLKTIHIPKSMKTAPFLQHPDLTTGQKRYLCSIANVYSTEHMRTQIRRQYLNMLQHCMQTGSIMSCENSNSSAKVLLHQQTLSQVGKRTEPLRNNKPIPGGHRQTHTGNIVLPSIIDGGHRVQSSMPASNQRRTSKAKTKTGTQKEERYQD
ncbi:protein FAM216A-like [Polyodon spathula]|uniref:protein FAM216A-like n=1 Tax=Polyodon spathula TaxID=7913 RepID=UPI001B7F3DF1|nr:protein FAM216A-like [Polyodon spathula]